jgi:hypothetical protein
MKLKRRDAGFVVSLLFCVAGVAQVPIQPVQWTGSLVPKTQAKPGMKIAIELSAEVQSGWHDYGLAQLPGGPTPLRVTLESNDAVQVAGETSGTIPEKKHDTAFDLDTEIYKKSFKLHLPLAINQRLVVGINPVFVSIRFQACNDRVCLPPRTVHVSVPIEVSQSN